MASVLVAEYAKRTVSVYWENLDYVNCRKKSDDGRILGPHTSIQLLKDQELAATGTNGRKDQITFSTVSTLKVMKTVMK